MTFVGICIGWPWRLGWTSGGKDCDRIWWFGPIGIGYDLPLGRW